MIALVMNSNTRAIKEVNLCMPSIGTPMNKQMPIPTFDHGVGMFFTVGHMPSNCEENHHAGMG